MGSRSCSVVIAVSPPCGSRTNTYWVVSFGDGVTSDMTTTGIVLPLQFLYAYVVPMLGVVGGWLDCVLKIDLSESEIVAVYPKVKLLSRSSVVVGSYGVASTYGSSFFHTMGMRDDPMLIPEFRPENVTETSFGTPVLSTQLRVPMTGIGTAEHTMHGRRVVQVRPSSDRIFTHRQPFPSAWRVCWSPTSTRTSARVKPCTSCGDGATSHVAPLSQR